MSKTIKCKGCGAEIQKGVKKCPQCGKKNKKPIKWIILVVIVLLIMIAYISASKREEESRKVEYSWPKSGIATLLPEPESEYGDINSDSETFFSIDIYEVSQNEFNDYVERCKEEGFTVDYHGSSSSYQADDAEGNSLSLYYYESREELSITIRAFEEAEQDLTENDVNTEAEEDTSVEDDISAETGSETLSEEDANTDTLEEAETETAIENDMEFRAWVDSYEEFMNEYVDFMVKFNESDGTDLTLLADYSTIMAKYTEFMEQTENINEDELSAEDYKYYVDAQARVLVRLNEIQ